MGDEPSRRVLLAGGHLDGQWVDVAEAAYSYRVLKPMELRFFGDPDPAKVPMPEFVDYRLERISIAIRTARADLWIGVADELHSPERDQAIIRVLFQRDVALSFQESP